MQPLSRTLQSKHELNRLCAEAVQQQIERGETDTTQLRNHRRHLVNQVLKRIPKATGMASCRLLPSVTLVLAMWGFAGLVLPQQAQAAPVFKHTSLAGFDVGNFVAPHFADIDGDLDAVKLY